VILFYLFLNFSAQPQVPYLTAIYIHKKSWCACSRPIRSHNIINKLYIQYTLKVTLLLASNRHQTLTYQPLTAFSIM